MFQRDLIINQPIFKGLKVGVRKNPIINGKHEGYYHLTSKDYENTGFENRIFDPRRSERLHWIKPVIHNYGCTKDCCSRIKLWTEKKRTHILFEDENYIVVLDKRNGYYSLVTAYFIDHFHTLSKLLRRYENHK